MPAPDPRDRGLDPAHILAVCSRSTSGAGDQLVLAVARPDGVRACLPSRPASRNARAALARDGYQVATIGRGRDLLITGWSPAGLESRLAAMRAILHQLAGHPSVTARAVIEQFRDLPAGSPISRARRQVLDQARARLRAWVSARSGIHAPHDPAVQPADIGNALRLRAAWTLEQAIDDLIERHLRVAADALTLFISLTRQVSSDHAQNAAIRRAGITFGLSGSPARIPPHCCRAPSCHLASACPQGRALQSACGLCPASLPSASSRPQPPATKCRQARRGRR